jgi:hypothetical protein
MHCLASQPDCFFVIQSDDYGDQLHTTEAQLSLDLEGCLVGWDTATQAVGVRLPRKPHVNFKNKDSAIYLLCLAWWLADTILLLHFQRLQHY